MQRAARPSSNLLPRGRRQPTFTPHLRGSAQRHLGRLLRTPQRGSHASTSALLRRCAPASVPDESLGSAIPLRIQNTPAVGIPTLTGRRREAHDAGDIDGIAPPPVPEFVRDTDTARSAVS